MTTTTGPSFRQHPPRALLIDSGASPSVMRSLEMQGIEVELLTSVAEVFEREYRPYPDFIFLMNNLPDGTWLAGLLAATHRWKSTIIVVAGSGMAPDGLTRGETAILRCLAAGECTTAQIAKELSLSPAGIQSSISRLGNKLGYRRAELVLFAYALGLAARQAAEEENSRAGRN